MEKQSPPWLQELLDAAEEKEQRQLIAMNKIKADQALAAIAVLEEKIAEVNSIADSEINLIQLWDESEVTKLQKKISWLSWNLENYMKALGEKTVTLPHGQLKLRMGKDKVEVTNMEQFLPVAQKTGLLRTIKESFEPDLNAIHEFIKLKGKVPAGVLLTPATNKFSYKTTKGNNNEHDDDKRSTTETGAAVEHPGKAETVKA